MKAAIIIPLYKGIEYVAQIVDMAENNARNTSAEVELVIVNDSPGTHDHAEVEKSLLAAKVEKVSMSGKTIEAGDEFFTEYIYKSGKLGIKLIECVRNGGIHQARVYGIMSTDAEYVLMLDQDDKITDNAIGLMADSIGDNDVLIVNGERTGLYDLYSKKAAIKLACKEWMYIYGTDMIFSPGQCLIKKKAIPNEWMSNILKVNGCDDFYLWLLMFNNYRQFSYLYKKLYIHVESEQNYSNESQAMTESYYAVCEMLKNTNYDRAKADILVKRYKFRQNMKSAESKWKKMWLGICNIKEAYATVLYKISGFH